MDEVQEPKNFQSWTSFESFEDLYRKDARVKIWHLALGKSWKTSSLVYSSYDIKNTTKAIQKMEKSRWIRDLEIGFFEMVQWICSLIPNFTPYALQFMLQLGLFQPSHRIAQYNSIQNLPHRIPQHPEIEYAIPVEEALPAIHEFQDYIESNKLMINHIVEIRFVAQDSIWLSPNYNRDSCHITLLIYNWNQVKVEKYFQGFEKIMLKYKGRPHWAKWFYLSQSQLRHLYPHWEHFKELRQHLDPKGIFLNAYLRRIFGL